MSTAFVSQDFQTDACQHVADAVRHAGFPDFLVGLMTAIARAESGCRTDATNKTGKEFSVGPFQINLLAHPDITEECARDYDCSARAAYTISGGGADLSPWTAYTSGRYLQFLFPLEGLKQVFGLGGQGSAFHPVSTSATVTKYVTVVVGLVLIIVAVSAIRRKKG